MNRTEFLEGEGFLWQLPGVRWGGVVVVNLLPRELPGNRNAGLPWEVGPESLITGGATDGAGGTLGRATYQLASLNSSTFKFDDTMACLYTLILTTFVQEDLTPKP